MRHGPVDVGVKAHSVAMLVRECEFGDVHRQKRSISDYKIPQEMA